jgi:hypothetical protein
MEEAKYALTELSKCGIFCPAIQYKDFVREGHKFKIKHFKYAFKILTEENDKRK